MGARPVAVVLLSGGLDSCVTAAIAAQDHELALLHASYGQLTQRREKQAFAEVADRFGVPGHMRRELSLDFLAALGGSALTDSTMDMPEGPPGPGVPATYVPFRNAHLISAAVSWAELIPARSVWIGAVEEDSSGYPDCRERFLEAFGSAIRLGTRAGEELRLVAPLVRMSKRQIVERGLELGAPLELTWSCYRNVKTACGRCESCWLRLRAFREAGAVDPIAYAS